MTKMNEYYQMNKKNLENLNISSKLLTQAFGTEKINYKMFFKIIKKDQNIVKSYLKNPFFFNSSYDLFLKDKKENDENKINQKKTQNNFLNKKHSFQINLMDLKNNLNYSNNKKDIKNINELNKHKSLPLIVSSRDSLNKKVFSIINQSNSKDNKEGDDKNRSFSMNLSNISLNINNIIPLTERSIKNNYSKIFKIKNNENENIEKNNNNKTNIINKLKINLIEKYNDKNYENKNNEISDSYRKEQCEKLMKKCSIGIKKSQSLDRIIDKKLGLNKKKKNNLIEKEFITSLIDKKSKLKPKYKSKEKENFKEIKKRINLKISFDFLKKNKNLYHYLLENKNINAYSMYLKDLTEIKNEKIKFRKMEYERINKIENLLEDTYKFKQYILSKINQTNKKNQEIKKKEKEGSFYYPLKEEYTLF